LKKESLCNVLHGEGGSLEKEKEGNKNSMKEKEELRKKKN